MFLKTPLSSFQNLFSRLTQKLRYELGSSMLEVTIAPVALVGSAGIAGSVAYEQLTEGATEAQVGSTFRILLAMWFNNEPYSLLHNDGSGYILNDELPTYLDEMGMSGYQMLRSESGKMRGNICFRLFAVEHPRHCSNPTPTPIDGFSTSCSGLDMNNSGLLMDGCFVHGWGTSGVVDRTAACDEINIAAQHYADTMSEHGCYKSHHMLCAIGVTAKNTVGPHCFASKESAFGIQARGLPTLPSSSGWGSSGGSSGGSTSSSGGSSGGGLSSTSSSGGGNGDDPVGKSPNSDDESKANKKETDPPTKGTKTTTPPGGRPINIARPPLASLVTGEPTTGTNPPPPINIEPISGGAVRPPSLPGEPTTFGSIGTGLANTPPSTHQPGLVNGEPTGGVGVEW
jgi:uncharacterized membrane protein YgcG